MVRRRRRAPVGLLVFLLVGALAAVGLYAVDRYALHRVQGEAASELQDELGTPTPPRVEVEGWPFLTQAAARHLHTVHVVADDVGAHGGSAVPVAHVDLVLTDVRSPDWFATMTADHAEGTARLDYAALGTLTSMPLTSMPLTYAEDGRLRVDVSTSTLGIEVAAKITGTPQLDVDAQEVTLTDPTIDLGAVNVPTSTAQALLRVLLRPIPVRGLPFGLRLTSLTAQDDGVHVGLRGDDVALRR